MMRSEMPFTAWKRISSAFLKASSSDIVLPPRPSRRWFGITMRVSTIFLSSASPSSACRSRFFPSKRKGLVTTATVSAPMLLAISAMMGAPPVPVPPPRPQVMKTMSAPASAVLTESMVSMAARLPTSGSEPAPRPRVTSFPSWTLMGASDALRAWASVLAAMKSTPSRLQWIMVFRALPPPPPMPTTLIRAVPLDDVPPSSSSNIRLPPVRRIRKTTS